MLVPEILLQILHPFEVRDRHAAGIGEDVWNNSRPFCRQDPIGFWCRWPIRPFGHDPGPYTIGVLLRNLPFGRGGNQDIAVELKNLLVGNPIAITVLGDGTSLSILSQHLSNIESVCAIDPDRKSVV